MYRTTCPTNTENALFLSIGGSFAIINCTRLRRTLGWSQNPYNKPGRRGLPGPCFQDKLEAAWGATGSVRIQTQCPIPERHSERLPCPACLCDDWLLSSAVISSLSYPFHFGGVSEEAEIHVYVWSTMLSRGHGDFLNLVKAGPCSLENMLSGETWEARILSGIAAVLEVMAVSKTR